MMDQYPSIIDSDMDVPTRHSIGVRTSDLHPLEDRRRLYSHGDLSNPSYFNYTPYTPNETTPGHVDTNLVQRSQYHTGSPEVSNSPPPAHQVEGSSTTPNRG